MNCLRINQIYLYLEGELSPAENKSIEEHLSSCLICKKAVKERKLLLQASRSLPLWNTPPDFSHHYRHNHQNFRPRHSFLLLWRKHFQSLWRKATFSAFGCLSWFYSSEFYRFYSNYRLAVHLRFEHNRVGSGY